MKATQWVPACQSGQSDNSAAGTVSRHSNFVSEHLNKTANHPHFSIGQNVAKRVKESLSLPQLRISLEMFAAERDGRLPGSEGVSDDAGENMDRGVHGRPVA